MKLREIVLEFEGSKNEIQFRLPPILARSVAKMADIWLDDIETTTEASGYSEQQIMNLKNSLPLVKKKHLRILSTMVEFFHSDTEGFSDQVIDGLNKFIRSASL